MGGGKVLWLVRQEEEQWADASEQGLPADSCLPVLADGQCHFQLQDLL